MRARSPALPRIWIPSSSELASSRSPTSHEARRDLGSRAEVQVGSEQSGRRPVLVSSDGFNAIDGWRSVIVIPCSTSDKQRARGPTAVPLRKGVGGLRKSSVAVCHQITTLDRVKLVTRWGALGAEDLAAVEQGILAALDL